ncbi:DUF2059 domain-containing protein [Litorisediminicola beolgyonensis]|uniref:DUF2059 domain-containing protein n=1 Tax=Litorisediminicola beolgyonensis TaxID=1173614 RepID=A0ABW3ZF25_9RHOB
MLRRTVFALVAAVSAGPVWASEQSDRLLDALELDRIVAIMIEEGTEYGTDIGTAMLPDGGGAEWQGIVARIYDAGAMAETVRAGVDAALGEADIAQAIDFFESDRGQRIVDMELEAREAMLDAEIEEAARAAWLDRADDGSELVAKIETFIETNDLIESNVVGALNSSLRFYNGLADGGLLEMSDDEILSEVWAEEPQTRDETTEWVHGFLLMAYGPLAPEDFDAYQALSESEAGQAMNRALFAGFNAMYFEISYALGLAVAGQSVATEL